MSRVSAEARIGLPPVQPDLLRFVDRADKQTDLNGEELDVGEVDLDVADDDKTLVEHPVKDVYKTVAARRGY